MRPIRRLGRGRPSASATLVVRDRTEIEGDIYRPVASATGALPLIAALGLINFVCFAAATTLSHGLSLLAPYGVPQYGEMAFYAQLGKLAPLQHSGEWALQIATRFSDPHLFLVAYTAPVLVTSLVFVVLIAVLGHWRNQLPPKTPGLMFGFAAVFAATNALAMPVLVRDFWLSIAWGRMAISGVNPYYNDLTPASIVGTPLVLGPGTHMTYGPLWALVSALLVWAASGGALMAYLLFKLLLTGVWTLCAWLIWRVLQPQSTWHQCMGLAIFGWLPLSVMQAVAEGHNDVFMLVFVLLWLLAALYSRAGAGVSLAACVAAKYVGAPLFMLDFLWQVRARRVPVRGYVPRAMLACGVLVVLFAPFFRSPDFFTPMTSMRTWDYYSPIEALTGLQVVTGLPLGILAQPVGLIFPAIGVYYTLQFVLHPDPNQFRLAILAVLCVVLFRLVGHVWPWFVLWSLVPAALTAEAGLSRWVVGFGWAAPFPLLIWTVFPWLGDEWRHQVPSLAWYAVAAICWSIMSRDSLVSKVRQVRSLMRPAPSDIATSHSGG
jgi:hypothetical protein